MSPYGKEIQSLPLPPQAPGGPLWDGCIEAGDTNYIVPRGYAHVIADIRGTGYSGGEYAGVFSQKEGEDGYDLVEWIAQQPWCDGNVGMVGMSYFGGIQPRVAIEQPPHLKAIMPVAAWTDTYRHVMYHGGVLCLFWYGLWDGRGGDSGYAMKNVVSATAKNLPKEEFERRLQETLNNPDIQKFSNLYHLLKYPQKNPLFVDILLNPCDGPFYWERSAVTKLEKINVPVFAIGGWLRGWLAAGAISIYNGVKTPKKLLIDPTAAWGRPWVTYQEEAIRWFDHWLKGIDTGIMDEPSINIFIRGINQWRYENEWPLERTRPIKFYLRSFGGLSLEPETHMDEPDCFVQQPLHVSYEIQSLKYLSPPMSEDMEVTGPVAFHLFASNDQEDTNWIVGLYDVNEKTSQLLSTGYLKASHRATDKSRSTPLQPYHPHITSEPILPGEVYEYAIELSPISNVFKAGHRIMLEIRSLEHSKEPEGIQPPFFVHLCSSRPTVHKIYRDQEHRSHLLLPIIPKEE
jgi:predicted acyl esterase